MDSLVELIMSPTYGTKALDSSQEEKQKHSQENQQQSDLYKKTKKAYISDNEVENIEIKQRQNTWTQKDRRKGRDRRKEAAERGRWLDSRHKKDRRSTSTDIFVKI